MALNKTAKLPDTFDFYVKKCSYQVLNTKEFETLETKVVRHWRQDNGSIKNQRSWPQR